MPTPRRESAHGPTSASSYVLECKLLRAYDALYQQHIGNIWHPVTRQATQAAVFAGIVGDAYAHRWGAQRLTHGMPEIIRRLSHKQQEAVVAVLLAPPEPDLHQVVALLVQLERNINYRDDDPRLNINDDARLKAAGMGRLTQQQYELTKPKHRKSNLPSALAS
jgi:hypothetical protein